MRKHLALILIAALTSYSVFSAEAELKMLPTMNVVEETSSNVEREEVAAFMKSQKVQAELINQGVDPKEALERLATLTNAEVKSLSNQIKNAQAGGDFGVGSIIGVMVFVFVVLLITDILGFTKVFPFTRSVR